MINFAQDHNALTRARGLSSRPGLEFIALTIRPMNFPSPAITLYAKKFLL